MRKKALRYRNLHSPGCSATAVCSAPPHPMHARTAPRLAPKLLALVHPSKIQIDRRATPQPAAVALLQREAAVSAQTQAAEIDEQAWLAGITLDLPGGCDVVIIARVDCNDSPALAIQRRFEAAQMRLRHRLISVRTTIKLNCPQRKQGSDPLLACGLVNFRLPRRPSSPC